MEEILGLKGEISGCLLGVVEGGGELRWRGQGIEKVN